MASNRDSNDHKVNRKHQQALLTLIESLQIELKHLHEGIESGALSYSTISQLCRMIEHRLHMLSTACAKKDLDEFADSSAPAVVPDAEETSLTPADLKGLSDPNSPISDIVIYRHPLSELGLIFGFVVLTVLAFIYSPKYEWSIQYVSFGGFFDLPIPFFALVPLVVGSFIIHRMYDCKYVVSHDHVRAVSGLLSLAEKDIRVDYENVRGIQVDKSIPQRILQLGDVYVGSSMHADVEIVMRGVLHPRHIREEIEERIKHHFSRLSRNTIVERVRAIEGSEE